MKSTQFLTIDQASELIDSISKYLPIFRGHEVPILKGSGVPQDFRLEVPINLPETPADAPQAHLDTVINDSMDMWGMAAAYRLGKLLWGWEFIDPIVDLGMEIEVRRSDLCNPDLCEDLGCNAELIISAVVQGDRRTKTDFPARLSANPA